MPNITHIDAACRPCGSAGWKTSNHAWTELRTVNNYKLIALQSKQKISCTCSSWSISKLCERRNKIVLWIWACAADVKHHVFVWFHLQEVMALKRQVASYNVIRNEYQAQLLQTLKRHAVSCASCYTEVLGTEGGGGKKMLSVINWMAKLDSWTPANTAKWVYYTQHPPWLS